MGTMLHPRRRLRPLFRRAPFTALKTGRRDPFQLKLAGTGSCRVGPGASRPTHGAAGNSSRLHAPTRAPPAAPSGVSASSEGSPGPEPPRPGPRSGCATGPSPHTPPVSIRGHTQKTARRSTGVNPVEIYHPPRGGDEISGTLTPEDRCAVGLARVQQNDFMWSKVKIGGMI